VFSGETLTRAVDPGRVPDMVDGLMSISVHAGEVFANQEKAIHWLHSPNPSLEGKTPLAAAQDYQEVKDVLVRIEHGVLG
jgi:uncharacterized protein (DUF2384 family)